MALLQLFSRRSNSAIVIAFFHSRCNLHVTRQSFINEFPRELTHGTKGFPNRQSSINRNALSIWRQSLLLHDEDSSSHFDNEWHVRTFESPRCSNRCSCTHRSIPTYFVQATVKCLESCPENEEQVRLKQREPFVSFNPAESDERDGYWLVSLCSSLENDWEKLNTTEASERKKQISMLKHPLVDLSVYDSANYLPKSMSYLKERLASITSSYDSPLTFGYVFK